MIKIQNDKGETLFEVKDDFVKPRKIVQSVVEDETTVCVACKQVGPNKPGEYICPKCNRNLLHYEDLEDLEEEE